MKTGLNYTRFMDFQAVLCMTEANLIASPKPLSRRVVADPEINNGEPFEYGPVDNAYITAYLKGTYYGIKILSIEDDRYGANIWRADALSNLPKMLPECVYFLDDDFGFDSKNELVNTPEDRLSLKRLRAYVRSVVEEMGELDMLSLIVPDILPCMENIPSVTMCVDDLDLDGDRFYFKHGLLYRFVSRENAPCPVYHGSLHRNNYSCITLLACPEKLPDGYAKEYNLEYPDGVTTPYFNQFHIDRSKLHMGLEMFYWYYLQVLSTNLTNILPKNLYISALNPSFYPYGCLDERKKRRNVVEKLLRYLQSIVDMQGEVWYIRQWLPDKIATAESVEIRTMKVSDLDIRGEEFEFELCVLYHFVK